MTESKKELEIKGENNFRHEGQTRSIRKKKIEKNALREIYTFLKQKEIKKYLNKSDECWKEIRPTI